MRKVVLQPLVGALGLTFGMTRDQARAVLGTPHQSFRKGSEVDAWMQGCVHVFYSEGSLQIEYIEVFREPGLSVLCLGCDLFGHRASGVIHALERNSRIAPIKEEKGARYTFKALELGLWRPFASLWGQGAYFASAGIGRAGYFPDATR